jgi:hypothetical protein
MSKPISVDFERFKEETGLVDYDVKELYKGFIEELLAEKEKLRLQLGQYDFEKMARTVHNIKGISGSYMADEVFKCSLELGRILSGNDRAAVVSATDRLNGAIMEAAGEIFRFVRS